MKLKNTSTRTYIAGLYRIEAGQEIEVDDEKMANILLNQKGIEEAIDKEEFEKLKQQVKELKETKKVAKTTKTTKAKKATKKD